MVGFWYCLINENGEIIKKYRPTIESFKIKKAFLYSASIIHLGSMIRKEALKMVNFYDEYFKFAQDRDLWFRILKYYKLGIVPEFLLKFRYSSQSISLQREIEQKIFCLKAIKKALREGVYPKWYYLFILRHLNFIYLPKPLRIFKNKLFNQLGLRYDQK